MRKAFTLIELAIVIVIVGLIVGGVLGAQSLVKSSKRTAVIKEIGQIRSVIKAFKLEYDQLPGDFDEADQYWSNCDEFGGGSSRCNGDNNGKIVHNVVGGTMEAYESYKLWRHLNLAELIPGNFTGFVNQESYGSAPLGAYVGKNVMPSSYDGGGYMVGYSNARTSTSFTGQIVHAGSSYLFCCKHYIAFGQALNGSAHMSDYIVSPNFASSIDKKTDDNIAWTGKVITTGLNNTCTIRINGSDALGGHLYNYGEDEISCRMFFEMD